VTDRPLCPLPETGTRGNWLRWCRGLLLLFALCAAVAMTGRAAANARVAFRLTTQHGTTFTDRDIGATPLAIFFGFTHCPDVCPTTLLQMTQDLQELGPDADRIKVLFISVDPERDTPDVLKSFMAPFDPRIVALTGAPQSVAAMAHAYGAHYRKIPTGEGYSVDHTASVFLVDREGEYVGALTFADESGARLDALRRLLP
jgi:protein SCO1